MKNFGQLWALVLATGRTEREANSLLATSEPCRKKLPIGSASGRIKSIFGNGAMIEGWAVYAERMMPESGYGEDTAESWLIYSKWNLRSVTNAILDYGVHVLHMSQEQAQKLLTREAFQSSEEATGKWRRVQLTSVQLTSYYAGYSAIYGLRERLKRKWGDRFELKRFHEQFLSYGSAPINLIEPLMIEHGP